MLIAILATVMFAAMLAATFNALREETAEARVEANGHNGQHRTSRF